jgi:hypothetical protein
MTSTLARVGVAGDATAVALFGLDPAAYRPHAVHGPARTYPETNCYTDLLIELVHARGDESLAILGSTVRMELERGQFTFFKPHPDDLEALLGIDVHETQPETDLVGQIADTIRIGRTLTIEVDAWFLPDTAGTSYRREHVKTTIAIEAIDPRREHLVYFHNASLYALEGDDFRGVFRLDPAPPDGVLPGYTELVRFDERARLGGDPLRAAAAAATRRHLARRPTGNPFVAFEARLAADLPGLLDGNLERFHAYAFATVRMAGAGAELLASHVEWLLGDGGRGAAEAFGRIVEGSKLLGFKLARRRPFDPEPYVRDMATAWDEATSRLERALAGR